MLEIAWKTYPYTWYLFEEGEEVVYRLIICNLLSVLAHLILIFSINTNCESMAY